MSERVISTDSPVIVKTKQLMAGASGVLSLAQGMLCACHHPSALHTNSRANATRSYLVHVT